MFDKKWLLPALVLALIWSPAPAKATILWAGGEDTDFIDVGTTGVSTSAGTFRSAYAREAVTVSSGANTSDPPTNYIQTPTFTATSTLWIHAQFYQNTQNANTNQEGIFVSSPDGVDRILLRQTGSGGIYKVSTRNSAGTITDLATATNAAVVGINQLDLYINYTCSGSGGVQFYVNNQQVINYSGNPCTDSATQLNQVGFAVLDLNQLNEWSEVIISTTSTQAMALYTAAPAAAGNTQSWTPNTVGNINETTNSDTTFISSGTANQLSEWTVTNSLPSGSWNVLAVAQTARALVGTSGPQHFEWLARTGSTDNVTGSVAPGTSFTNGFYNIWSTNPNTGVAWTSSDVTNAGFNLGIESLN